MNRTALGFGLVLAMLPSTQVRAQDPKEVLQQKIGQVKQSMAENQARLRQYSWVETTEVSLKGEVKKREQKQCQYGPDGKIQKTSLGGDSGGGGGEAKGGGRRGGVKQKVVEKKKDEMKDYMDRVGSLVKRYVPPNPETMQAAFQAGKASLDKANASLVFRDLVKPGDQMTLAFDPAAKKLRSLAVASYLDSPEDQVTLSAGFSSLADGTNFLQETVLIAKAKQIQIKTTNFDHKKLGQ